MREDRCWATGPPPKNRTFQVPNTQSSRPVWLEDFGRLESETTLRKQRRQQFGSFSYHFLRWYVRDFKHPSIKLKQIQENDFIEKQIFQRSQIAVHFWRILTALCTTYPKLTLTICGIWADLFCVCLLRLFLPKRWPAPCCIETRMSVRHQFFAFFIGLWKKNDRFFTDFPGIWLNFAGPTDVSKCFKVRKKICRKIAMFINIGYGKAGAPWRESQWMRKSSGPR